MKLKFLVSCSLAALAACRDCRRRRRSRSSGGTRWAARSANGSTTWPRASTTSQKEYKVVPTFKGSYPESMTAGIAAFRAGNAPRHPAGVRGRHRDDDGEQGRDRAGRQGHEGRRPEVRPDRLRAGGRRLLHGAERPDAELAVQQLDDRSSTTTRTPSRPPASTPSKPPDDLARGGARRRQAEGQRPQVPVHDQLDQLDPARELLGLAQRRVRDQEQRLRRHRTRAWPSTRRCTCATSRTSPTWPSRACSSTRAATTRPTPPSSPANAR